MRLATVFVASTVCAGLGSVAAAQEEQAPATRDAVIHGPHPEGSTDLSQNDDARARELFVLGQEAFDTARYEEALQRFRAAYALSHRSMLHYNIGLSLERLHRFAEARESYRAYLAETDSPPNRADAEARIEALGEVSAPPAVVSTKRRSRVPLVLMIGGALVIAGGASLLGVGMARMARLDATAPGTRQWSDVHRDADRARVLQLSGAITLGVGAALTLVGLILRFTGKRAAVANLRWNGADVRWMF